MLFSSTAGMPSPEQFSSSLFGQNFSVPNRKTSVASRNQDLSPIQQPQHSPFVPASSYMPPPSHFSLVFDYPSSYPQPEELRYGPRGSQSYYPPMSSGSVYFPEAVSLSPSDSPPPSLPAKSNLRRSTDRLDPIAHPSFRMSEYSNSSQFNDYNAASELQRNRCCKSYAGNDYDVLPRRSFDDEKDYDYDFPPPPRSGMASGQHLPPDSSANRASASSYPGTHWTRIHICMFVCI